ncbi:MAG: hypothetical protein V8R75_10990 [Oscillospiraceae bacterium]
MNDMTAKLAEQLKSNPAALRSLMQSQDGQALIWMLTPGRPGRRAANRRPKRQPRAIRPS